MLSYIVRLTTDFEREHGLRPNLLYLSQAHVRQLQEDFDPRFDLQTIMRMLRMEVLIDSAIVHPHVAWVQPAARKRAG